MPPAIRDLRKYVEDNSIPEPNTGCWIWMLSLRNGRYGQVNVAGHMQAHRLSYAAFKGPIPSGMLVRHACDSKWCVAPHHLSVGDTAANMIDRQVRDRVGKRLRITDVRSIRADIRSHREVAVDHGVSRSLVRQVRRRVIWKHVA
jgi:hypothetical protein